MIHPTRSTLRKARLSGVLLAALKETRADIAAGRFEVLTAAQHKTQMERMLRSAKLAIHLNEESTSSELA